MSSPTGEGAKVASSDYSRGHQVRYRMAISYAGTDFSGWAIQPGHRTVQGELELWTSRILGISPITLLCAGRTDAGVHARGQVAHFDVPEEIDATELTRRLGRVLRPDVIVHEVRQAEPGFHARFAALWRRYCYRVADRPLDPLLRGFVTRSRPPIDIELLNQAGASLLGLRNFAAFCRRREGATTTRTLLQLHAVRATEGPLAGIVEVRVVADAFCHSMVRSLMGAVMDVAYGRQDLDWLAEVANSPERNHRVTVMPARGLTLEEVRYPPAGALSERVREARSKRREATPGRDSTVVL